MDKTEKKNKKAGQEPDAEKQETEAGAAGVNEVSEPAESPVEPEVIPEPAEPEEKKPSEAEIYKDKYLRLQADFDNYRKRMVRERQEIILRANEDLLGELLVPMDHLDHALAAMKKTLGDEDPCVKGVEIVKSEMLSTLGRFGVKQIETEKVAFDPNKHEALGKMPVPGKAEDEIVAVVRSGYFLNGKVLRAAQVMLAAGDPSAAVQPSEAESADGASDSTGEK